MITWLKCGIKPTYKIRNGVANGICGMTYKTRNAEFSEIYKFNHNNNDEQNGRTKRKNETDGRKDEMNGLKDGRTRHRIRMSLLQLVNV